MPSNVRHTRTRAGCLTCRSRRKKCDEVKPRCAGCRRNQLPCTWPSDRDPITIRLRGDNPRSSSSASRSGSASTEAGDGRGSVAATTAASGATRRRRQVVPSVPASITIPPPVPVMVHRGAEDAQRACTLTPHSVPLLTHFLTHTASLFAMGPLQENPFVTLLVPLASVDDLLMHALLALSGAHLTSKDPAGAEVARATHMHYARLISGLQRELASLEQDSLDKKERLLRLLLVACHYEAISGNTDGALFAHLRASRHIVNSLVSYRDSMSRQLWDAFIDPSTFGFSLELYTYLVLCNTIVQPSAADNIAGDADDIAMPLSDMADFPTFGALFAGGHELYGLIPDISQLASERLDEEAAGSVQPSESIKLVYAQLDDRLSTWKMPPPSCSGEKDRPAKVSAAEALRHALHVYLITALAGSVVPDESRFDVIQHVNAVFKYAGEIIPRQQQYIATLLWPVIIASTCIVKPLPQQSVTQEIRKSWSSIRHMAILADVLQLMWDDPDPRAYGPYGLKMTMEKHDKVVGIL